MRRVALFSLMVSGMVLAQSIGPQVETPSGQIEGYYKYSYKGRQYRAFEGIRYAVPPTGDLRFEPPVAIEPWTELLVADEQGPGCFQSNPLSKGSFVGSEDCLYLNVYAPQLQEGCHELYPVVVFIFGGAFTSGYASSYGPEFMLDRDVILVSFDYRLGPLGFMSTEDDVVPGNMGLKDQSVALRWVYYNIRAFGGDPDKITITGQSAGASSVHYHYLSSWSRGLFRGGISLSGTAFNTFAQAKDPLEKAKAIATINDCPITSTAEMVDCLKEQSADNITKTISSFQVIFSTPTAPFGPVVEKGGSNPFIDRSPIEIIESGDAQDLPWITGVVSEEGLYPAGLFVANETLLKLVDNVWDADARYLLDFNSTIPTANQSEVARRIREHYLGSSAIDRSTVGHVIKLFGDRYHVVDAVKTARVQAANSESPIWFYYFSYRGAHSMTEFLTGTTANYGVCHTDDVGYLFGFALNNVTTTESDKAMQSDMVDFWMSFAINGFPNVGTDWPQFDPYAENVTYMHFAGPGNFSVDSKKNLGEDDFWNTINFDENKA